MIRTFKTTMLLGLLVALIGATSAFASSPSDETYLQKPSAVTHVLDDVTSSPSPSPSSESGTAPSTESGTAPSTTSSPSSPSSPAPSTPAAATPTTRTEQASSGNLPFTGFEAGLVAVAGLALLAGGFAMRRVSRDAS